MVLSIIILAYSLRMRRRPRSVVIHVFTLKDGLGSGLAGKISTGHGTNLYIFISARRTLNPLVTSVMRCGRHSIASQQSILRFTLSGMDMRLIFDDDISCRDTMASSILRHAPSFGHRSIFAVGNCPAR